MIYQKKTDASKATEKKITFVFVIQLNKLKKKYLDLYTKCKFI